jgi:transcription elongation factor GreA
MPENIYLTPEGAEQMRLELSELTSTGRQELAVRLRNAISMGDLSENADYHKAKEDQAFLEGRIQELEYLLKNAVLIEEHAGVREVVDIGARVTIQEEDYEPEEFYLVGAKEADPSRGKISNESPIGKALIGSRVGDTVIAHTPGGEIHLKVLAIA